MQLVDGNLVLSKDEILQNLKEKETHAQELITISQEAKQYGNSEYWLGYKTAIHDAKCLVESLKVESPKPVGL